MTVVDIAAARKTRPTPGRSPAYRAEQARALREQGRPFREIAEALGYSDGSAARKAAERGRAGWMLASDEDARLALLGRVEAMLNSLEPLIHCATPDVKAVEASRRLLDLQARLLGLFSGRPSRRDTTVEIPNLHAQAKADKVNRYMELADKLAGVAESGYGSGRAPADALDDDLEVDDAALATVPAPSGADTGGSCEGSDSEDDLNEFAEDELEKKPGEWKGGKFYPPVPSADLIAHQTPDEGHKLVPAAFDMSAR